MTSQSPHSDEEEAVALGYASQDAASRERVPADATVLRGLQYILVGIVLLPCVAGLILIMVLLLAGTENWAGKLDGLLSLPAAD